MNRWTIVAAALAVLGTVACTTVSESPTRILRRPTAIAVTCADAADVPVDRSRCGETGNVVTTWVVDADARGLAISTPPNGDHFDADPFEPGFTALPVGGDPVVVRATAASDLVLVAMRSDDATGKPALAWLDPAKLKPGLAPDRAPLPCAPIDMAVADVAPGGGGDPVPTIVLAYDCDALAGIAAFPLDARGEAADLRAGERRWTLPGTIRGFSIRADGGVAWIALAGDQGDSIARLDFALAPPGGLSPDQVVPLDASLPALPDPVPGCAASNADPLGSRILGAPVATPDGAFVYVPLARPDVVAVFDDGLRRIDVNAPVPGIEGSGNVLLQRLGIRDIPMDAPVRAIVMVDLGTTTDATDSTLHLELGVRAFAALQNGTLARIVVTPPQVKSDEGKAITDPANAVPHQPENGASDVDTTALMPVLRADGQVLSRSVVNNPEYPSFGSPEIATDPERSGKFTYYGIRFGGDLETELTERWDFTYEGVIPGATGCGTLEPLPGEAVAGVFRDPTADFCARGVMEAQGVRPGDVIVITPDPSASCDQAASDVLEYRITEVRSDRLVLQPAWVSLPLAPAGCFDGLPLAYEIRASGSWTVVGSRSGFLHNRKASEDGACVERPDADARFNGRALTTIPADGGPVLEACPIRLGDRAMGENWAASRFANAAFSASVVPGCKTDSRFRPVWLLPSRDTHLTFQATSGSSPRILTLGALPDEMVVAGTTIYSLDAGAGAVYAVDATLNSVTASWY